MHMVVPLFPFLGVYPNWTLLDPMTVFTPLTCILVLLSSLGGLGIGALLAARSKDACTKQPTALPSTPSSLSQAA